MNCLPWLSRPVTTCQYTWRVSIRSVPGRFKRSRRQSAHQRDASRDANARLLLADLLDDPSANLLRLVSHSRK